MAKKQLFPKEFIASSVEHYTFILRKQMMSIYLILIIAIISVIIALPFISINVSRTVNGVIGTETDRFGLNMPMSGFIFMNKLKENKHVQKGDTLLVLENGVLQKESDQLEARLLELTRFLNDLHQLIDNDAKGNDLLISSRFQISFLKFKTGYSKLETEKQYSQKIYERQKRLLKFKAISEVEFERDQSNYERAIAELDLFKKQAINEWKEQSLTIKEEQKRLLLHKKEIATEFLKYTLLAPATGELQQVVPLNTHQFITAGLKVGDITLDSMLLAICWVAPQDVGLIHKGMEGLFRIDAFNANEWGSLNGKVLEISSDVYLINSKPYFKVTCQLAQDYLTLKNGVLGKLKKGMTVQVNFTLANRTLHQLLYDKVDDWIDPTNS